MRVFEKKDLVAILLDVEYERKPFLVKVTAAEDIEGALLGPVVVDFAVSDPDSIIEICCACNTVKSSDISLTIEGVTKYALRVLEEKGDLLMGVYNRAISKIKAG